MTDAAERVVVSFRPPDTDEEEDWWVADSPWLEESMTEETYRTYLRRAHSGPVAVGEQWEEVVNCGCASPVEVRLHVERVEGGDDIADETAIEVVSQDGAPAATPTATE